MKRKYNILVFGFLFIVSSGCNKPQDNQEQIEAPKKQLVIFGDAHGLPDDKKAGYVPALEKLLEYKPDMIFSEHTIPGDTAAYGGWHSDFKNQHLRSQRNYKPDERRIINLLELPNSELDSTDFLELSDYYLFMGNMANQWMYDYFAKYGFEEYFAPRGNQNSDLTFELMRRLELKEIHGVDSHEGYNGYWPKWQECLKMGDSLSILNFEIIEKQLEKEDAGIAENKYLDYINSERTLDLYYKLNTLRLDGFEDSSCAIQQSKWDHRNRLIAENLKRIIDSNDYQKSVVIVGAGHVRALEIEFEKMEHDIDILMYRNL